MYLLSLIIKHSLSLYLSPLRPSLSISAYFARVFCALFPFPRRMPGKASGLGRAVDSYLLSMPQLLYSVCVSPSPIPLKKKTWTFIVPSMCVNIPYPAHLDHRDRTCSQWWWSLWVIFDFGERAWAKPSPNLMHAFCMEKFLETFWQAFWAGRVVDVHLFAFFLFSPQERLLSELWTEGRQSPNQLMAVGYPPSNVKRQRRDRRGRTPNNNNSHFLLFAVAFCFLSPLLFGLLNMVKTHWWWLVVGTRQMVTPPSFLFSMDMCTPPPPSLSPCKNAKGGENLLC